MHSKETGFPVQWNMNEDRLKKGKKSDKTKIKI